MQPLHSAAFLFRFRLSWTEPFLAFFSAALISPPTPCPMKAVNLTTIDIHSLLAHTPHEKSGFVRPSSCQGESTFEVEAFVRIPRGCRRSDLQHLLTSSSSCSSSACKWACSASNACSEQARDTPAHRLEYYVVFVLSHGSLSSSTSPNLQLPSKALYLPMHQRLRSPAWWWPGGEFASTVRKVVPLVELSRRCGQTARSSECTQDSRAEGFEVLRSSECTQDSRAEGFEAVRAGCPQQ